ncbi:hypothetical protein CBR_g40932 [Chara braunii]|uniref:Reverse transcriptase n=1 Tax=Chara braunii TaxID=69332 RepID=A0A388LUU4_CHABU|nr:hypothetical protein CBR_g40932 [Chara braunii]|eukprot:GBG86031.1 hypothetical protein CBR_g40932 [Chara braunii]
MMKDPKLYVETCQVCQRDKPRTQSPLGLLKPLPIPERPGESLSMDFMDTLVTSKSGKRYIYVIVDRFSKYARLVAMPETTKAKYVIKLFKENWVRDFGLAKSIISDRDVRFTSDLWKAAAAEQMTFGNHPEANGQAEQMNCAVQHLLRHYIKPNQVDWDEKLALIASLYNNTVHSARGSLSVSLWVVLSGEEWDCPIVQRGQYSGSKTDEMEKGISEWVANLSLGEEEEVAMNIPKDEQEAAMKEWDVEEDALKRQAMEDEKRMEWKLRMMREKKRRVEAASEADRELEQVKNLREQMAAQVDLQRKVEFIAQSNERLARVQGEQYEFNRSQDMVVRSMRMGFQDLAREVVGAVGAEVNHRLEKTERFCVGAIEGVKLTAPKEEEARPRREPVKVKFPDSYSGKREENFDNWEANVKTYVHLQQVSPDQHVLIAIHALRDEAASFARSPVRAANCNNDAVAYSSFTPLVDFMKLLRERFADVARSVKASDKLQTIHSRKWKSVRALKGVMDELVAVPDHRVTKTQLVGLKGNSSQRVKILPPLMIPLAVKCASRQETPTPHVPMAEVAGRCLDSCTETVCARVSLDTSLTGVAEELKERMPAWAKMKKENKGQLILVDTEIFRGRAGALVDSGATRSYISRKALQKLKLQLKVQRLADPIVSILADNRTMRVEEYVEGVQAYFRLEQDGKVEKVLHSLTLLVEDSLPFDVVLGMDWGEAAGATLLLREHECRLPCPSGGVKTSRLFHVSGVDNSLAHCCLSAPAFARLVKKEQLEEQVFVSYVRPVTEPKEEKPIDPAIAKLLEEFKDLAEPPIGVVPQPIQHRIEIEPGSRTPKGAVYRMSPRELEELRKQLDELLEKGWIRRSSSPFGAPVLFVPKKEGELRMCIDYRGLNAITVKNVEPLPRIDDLLDRVQGCRYFTKIDLKSGYHQIEVHPDDQYKTTFRTRYGHDKFIVMPFGLTNAPATFQRCMNDLFRPWLDRFVVVYLDVILVFGKTLEEHQGHLRQVLEKLREANFKINAKKCEWAKTQVLYLGHVLDGDGIKPEDSKIASIRDWPTPRTLTELRSFLGLANYNRKFVRNFSTIAAPLCRLLRKETIWKWDKDCKDCTSAMKKLK